MNYSNFAMRSPEGSIVEPIQKKRLSTGEILATYRDGNDTWRQKFPGNFESSLIEEIEEEEKQERPPAPEGNVMDWSSEEVDLFCEHYGRDAYQKLYGRALKNDGHAEYVKPQDEPKMPRPDQDPRSWSTIQVQNYISKYSREQYQDRIVQAYKADKEPMKG